MQLFSFTNKCISVEYSGGLRRRGHCMCLLLIISLCTSLYQENPLSSDDLLRKYFNADELNNLNEVRLSFNNFISEQCQDEGADYQDCYQAFFQDLRTDIKQRKEYKINISRKKQKEVLGSISSDLFHKIWKNTQGKYHNNSADSLLEYHAINISSIDSQYIKFWWRFRKYDDLID